MNKNIFVRLSEPFDANEIEYRIGNTNADKTSGLALAYLTARAVMNRLDDVVGPENWQDKYTPAPSSGGKAGWICELSLRLGDEWITKSDGADESDIEPIKGGISDAMKRAAVKWGIGRYLYSLPPVWVAIEASGRGYRMKQRPVLPAWALPSGKKSVDPNTDLGFEPEDEAPAPAPAPTKPSILKDGKVNPALVIRERLLDIAAENPGKQASPAQSNLVRLLMREAIPDNDTRALACSLIYEVDTWEEIDPRLVWGTLQWMNPQKTGRISKNGKEALAISEEAKNVLDDLVQTLIP